MIVATRKPLLASRYTQAATRKTLLANWLIADGSASGPLVEATGRPPADQR